MKTAGINELRALVADALTKADAEKLTEARVRATELAQEDDSASAATKADVANLRADLQRQLGELRGEVQKQIGDLRAEMGNVKSELLDKLRGQNMWIMSTFGPVTRHEPHYEGDEARDDQHDPEGNGNVDQADVPSSRGV